MTRLDKVRALTLKSPIQLIKKVLPKSRRRAQLRDDGALETSSVEYAAPDSHSTTHRSKGDIISFKSAKSRASMTKTKAAPPPPEECPICQDPVGIPNPEGITEAWTSLNCGHKFGTVCIQTWLQDSLDRDPNGTPSCPICRAVAKHPVCAHAVCPPSLDIQIWTQYQMRMQLAQHQERERQQQNGRRPRNRLQRRSGQPRPPSPPRRTAETVGECGICKLNEVRIKNAAETDTGVQREREAPSAAIGGARRVKSYLPSQIRIIRPAVGRERDSSGAGLTNPPAPPNREERHSRVRSVICNMQELARPSRSPTLAPETAFPLSRRDSI
ncbi:hypothetical protein PG999_010757 [Apiospora kogelbergensis]|uniref:RING-type domain-containing protein n=1 Tax=Apiospora kogelbergensis TaxID=1337665 RepID=A0AAW0QB38_9PEZI